MRYKLYNESNEGINIVDEILSSRGIVDTSIWINASMKDVAHWSKLDNIEKGVHRVRQAVDNSEKILIVVDPDVDGYTSAAILINYLYRLYPDYVKENINYIHHTGKQHGLSDIIDTIHDIDLVICPDSASNDYECHQKLWEQNIDLLILDHHQADYISWLSNVITVNNQLCDYPNKDFCGAGVVWQFCKAYNEIFNFNVYIDIDLCALGLISDMMDYRSVETRAVVVEGLSNIQNLFFKEMTINNEFTLNKYGGLCYKGIAFAVTPFINATVRSGTQEEKDIVFKAMCNCYNENLVPNTKRGHKGEEWPLYQQAAYLTSSIKRRQTKLEIESMELLENKIEEDNLLDNNILICCCEQSEIEPNIRGLAANKLASKYQRPCLVLTKALEDDDIYTYQGSARDYSMSEVDDLKSLEESTGLINYAQGHSAAHGVGLYESNLNAFISSMNNKLEGKVGKPVYWVDYIWPQNLITSNNLLSIAEMSCYWGQNINASQIVGKDIDLQNCKLSLCGKKNDTLRITLPNDVVLVRFGVEEEEYKKMLIDNVYMTCILSPSKNVWQGKVSGEAFIEDYFIETKWVF